MITRVNGFNPKGVTNGTRQESSPVSFAYSHTSPAYSHAPRGSRVSLRSSQAADRYESRSSVWKGTSLLAGAVGVAAVILLVNG